MTKNGQSIETAYLPGSLDTGINYDMSFLEWQAASAAGLSLWDWDQGVYPNSFKARVIAFYKLNNLVGSHIEAEKAKAAEKAAKKKR